MNDFDWIHDIEAYQSLLTDNLDDSHLVVIGAPCGHAKTWVMVNIGLKYRTNEKNVLHIIMGESVQSLATKYKMSGFNDIMDNKGKLIVKNYPYGDTMTIDDVVDYIRRANEGTKFDIVMIDKSYQMN
jgi:hypothetical protein